MDERLTRAKKRFEESVRKNVELTQKNDPETQIEALRATNISLYVNNLAELNHLTDNQKRFLSEYVKDGLVSHACYRAGVSVAAYYQWCKRDIFKDLLEETRKIANESLEKLAIDLSNGTYSKPVVSAGKLVTEERIYDTRMLTLLLKSRMPERYAQKVDITSGGQPLVKLVDKATWESL